MRNLNLIKKIFFVLLIICGSFFVSAQDQHVVDSLLKGFKIAKDDTTKANILYKLSTSYWGSNTEKAMDYAKQTLALSEKIGFKKGISNAYNSMGAISNDKGDYLPALEFYKKSLKIREELGNKIGVASSKNNIGNIYYYLGNYPEALKNYLSALKFYEEIGHKLGVANALSNVGIIYENQGNDSKALQYYLSSLKIFKEAGQKQGIAITFGNIGIIYDRQGKYAEALKNHLASLKIYEEIGYKNGIAGTYNNIGNIYNTQGLGKNVLPASRTEYLNKALNYHLAALALYEEIGDKYGVASTLGNIGSIYIKQKQYDEASLSLNKSLSLSKEIGSLEQAKDAYAYLAELDSTGGNFKGAMANYKLYIATRDSLENNETTQKMTQQQMQYDFDKKEATAKAEQKKKDDVERLTRNILIAGLVFVMLFAFVFLVQRNKISKGKKKSDELLLNILPAEVAEELKSTGNSKAKTFNMVSVMFTDFKDFTRISEKISAELLVDELHACFSAFDEIIHKHKVEKIKTIGDAYMCVSGLPVLNQTHATDIINAAIEISNFMLHRKKEKDARGEFSFELRIGINTGPVVAGIVGIKKFSYDIWGDTVNLAARMEHTSEPGKINISGATYELVKDKFKCQHRGKIEAKNKGEVDMYFVEGVI